MTEPAAKSDDLARVRSAVDAALGRQATDLRVLHLEPVCDFTDYFVICGGRSSRQVEAIADAVDDRLRAEGTKPLHTEGGKPGHWVLLDYGDFVVHVFDPERRGFYRLEDIWSDAEDVTDRFSDDSEPAAGR